MGNIDKNIIKARTMAELNKLLAKDVAKGWYIASDIKHLTNSTDTKYFYTNKK